MAYKVLTTKKFDKQFNKLNRVIQEQILDWLENNLENKDNPRHIGKALQGNLKGYWRYRVGDYRMICDIQDDKLIVLALQVGHRKHIYKLKR